MERQIFHQFFKYQVIITQFHNLSIIWTHEANLAIPDILSENVTLSDTNRLQLHRIEIPHDISYHDQNGYKMHYTIKDEDDQDASYNDSYPIICEQCNTRNTLRPKNDGHKYHVEV